jgi:uncharacterized protein (TIGR04222 family)
MNPITDFNAREFLTFYAVFILAVWMVRAWFNWRSDRTLDETWTPPLTPNAYDVAYLRGGASELARVAIVGLTERGFLEARAQTIGQAQGHPNPATLTALERSVFDFFQPERTVREIEQAGLRVRVNPHVLTFEERLQAAQLLSPSHIIAAARGTAVMAAAAIFVVGFARFLVALQRHRPAGFLIAMGVVGMIAVAWPRIGRLSRRGKAYLDSLREAASSFATRGTEPSDTSLFMATALFGMSALSGSSQDALGEMFTRQKAASAGASGDGGGWFPGVSDGGGGGNDGGGGGGGSDGGGGGGGCGGCGGGGCGGG